MGGPEHFSCEPAKSSDTASYVLKAANFLDESGKFAKNIDKAMCPDDQSGQNGILLPQEAAARKFQEARERRAQTVEQKDAPPSFSLVSTAAAAEQAEKPHDEIAQRFMDEMLNYPDMWTTLGVPTGDINEWNKRISTLTEAALALPGKTSDLPDKFFEIVLDEVSRAVANDQTGSFDDIAKKAVARASATRVASLN